jgi:hypothetical protein
MAAHPSVETMPIKDILYGLDFTEGMEHGVLVEGVTDAWRIGAGAVACFGIKYREPQVKLLCERFKRITVFFDPEPQAKIQAKKIIRELRAMGIKTLWVHPPKGKDAADLTSDEIKRILNI